jgi:CubicO group peptidase (beta-lactamase class C family)
MSQTLPPLPAQDTSTPWPTKDWPTGELPPQVDRQVLDKLIADALGGESDQLGETHALVVIHAGELVLERYAKGLGPAETFPSWSKAKSITQALVGILVSDGKLNIHAPAAVPEWSGEGDPRREINIDQLLRMSSGLKFVEDYEPGHPSDVIDMLFGSGKADVAHYAASQPLIHPPSSHWSYASGTTNIIARCAAQAVGENSAQFEAFMRERLFGPLGMTSPIPKFDGAGTFIGSSYCYATARDFARFGLLYLRDGVWEDRRILPEGWVDYARTATPQPADTDELSYGAHWWLGIAGDGSFSANGYEGQYTVCVPDLDLVIVRHGKTPLTLSRNPQRWIAEVADCFRGG